MILFLFLFLSSFSASLILHTFPMLAITINHWTLLYLHALAQCCTYCPKCLSFLWSAAECLLIIYNSAQKSSSFEYFPYPSCACLDTYTFMFLLYWSCNFCYSLTKVVLFISLAPNWTVSFMQRPCCIYHYVPIACTVPGTLINICGLKLRSLWMCINWDLDYSKVLTKVPFW